MKSSCGPGWEKGTGRLGDPRAKARAVNCWSSKMWWTVRPQVRLGKGKGNSFPNDKERLALCLMRGDMRGASFSAHSTRPLTTRAVDTSQQSWGRTSGLLGWKVGSVLFKESPIPRPLTCHIPPFMHTHRERERDACPQPRAQRETVGSLGVERTPSSHSGCGSGNWYTRTKEKTQLSSQEPGSA